MALLLPFPRLAALQLAQRIAEAYRQAMRLHAVLVSCAVARQKGSVVAFTGRQQSLLTVITRCW